MNLDLVFRHTSDAVLAVNADFVVTDANPRAETLLVSEATAMVGRPLADCIPDFRDSVAETETRDVASGHLERRVDHFSPTRYRWFEIRVVPSRPGAILFLRDVTDRARQMHTEAVREGVREVLINAPVAISIMRGPEHRFELVNRFAQEIIGTRQVEGKTIRDAFPELSSSLFDILDRVYRTGERFSTTDLEVELDRDGVRHKLWFDVTYQPLFAADGSVSGILSTSIDTTGYREARKHLEGGARKTG